MIEPKQLRVGNVINNNVGVAFCIPTIGDLVYVYNNPHNYSPIPLTEEWLLKLGFAWYNDIQQLYLDMWTPGHPSARFELNYTKEKGFRMWSRYEEHNNDAYVRHLRYVHQIQNLYYDLTSEELEIN